MGEKPAGGPPAATGSLSQRTTSAVLWTLLSQAAVAGISLASFTVMSRHVALGEFGQYLLALVALAAIQWCAYNAYKEPVIQAPEMTDELASSVFWFTALVGTALTAVTCVVAWVLSSYGQPVVALCLVLMTPKVLLDTLNSVPQALAYRRMAFRFMALQGAAGATLGACVSIALLLTGHGVVSIALAQNVAPLLTLLVLMRPRGGWQPRLHFRLRELGLLRRYSPHVLLWQFVEMTNAQIDRLLVGARLSSAALGLYGFGRRLNEVVISVLVGAASNVALPVFASIQREPERLQRAFVMAVRLVAFGVFPVIAMLFVLAERFVPWLFGSKWADAVPLYQCFLLLGLIQTIGILQASVIRGLGHANLWSRYQVVQAVANVVVSLIAIRYGVYVLAVALVLRTYAIWGWAVLMTCRVVGLPPLAYLMSLLPAVSCAILAGGAAWGVSHAAAGWPEPAGLLAAGAAGMALYLAASAMLQRSTLREVRQLISARLGQRPD